MKKIIVCAISLDGKIAKSSNDNLDWTVGSKKFFATVSKDAGVIIFGNNTYKQINKPLPDRLIKVITQSVVNKLDIKNQVEYTSQKPLEVIKELSKRGYTKVIIGGGASINTLFLENNLVDEIWLTIIPIVLGKGIGLFNDNIDISKKFELIGFENTDNNWLIVKYKLLTI